jgi:hypothetical protein
MKRGKATRRGSFQATQSALEDPGVVALQHSLIQLNKALGVQVRSAEQVRASSYLPGSPPGFLI